MTIHLRFCSSVVTHQFVQVWRFVRKQPHELLRSNNASNLIPGNLEHNCVCVCVVLCCAVPGVCSSYVFKSVQASCCFSCFFPGCLCGIVRSQGRAVVVVSASSDVVLFSSSSSCHCSVFYKVSFPAQLLNVLFFSLLMVLLWCLHPVVHLSSWICFLTHRISDHKKLYSGDGKGNVYVTMEVIEPTV